MNDHPKPSRALPVAAGVALVLFGGWHGWKVHRADLAEKHAAQRERLLWKADSLHPAEVDSFCNRGSMDSLLHRDGIAWFASREGLALSRRGRDDGWDWGCYATAEPGISVFLALDSGCASGGKGGLWTHSCRLERVTLDLELGKAGAPLGSSHVRSIWSDPGAVGICPLPTRPEPPSDSLALERCR